MNWNPDSLPSLIGKSYVVTGGNSGLGFETARILAEKGARVLITTRDETKARAALDSLRSILPKADLDFVLLDLTDPTSITAAATAIIDKCPHLDACINNGGVMQTPEVRTAEGFELQFSTNHLGHFRLNRALFSHIERSNGRIVAVSSIAHRGGNIRLDDLNAQKGYDSTAAYTQSKLANLMYSFELQRRLVARGSKAISIACHPGYAATNLQSTGVGMEGGSSFFRAVYKVTNSLVAQPAERGAWPSVLAAADPNAEPGGYYGPTGIGELRGKVGKAQASARAKDQAMAGALWDKTEALVGSFFG